MIENNAVKKMVNSILHNRQNTISDRDVMHPEREWFLGILVGVVIITLSIIWSVNTYKQFKSISAVNSVEQENSTIYKASLVEAALVDFTDRKEMYENLKRELIGKYKGKVSIPMPALESAEIASSTTPHYTSTTSPEEGDGAALIF